MDPGVKYVQMLYDMVSFGFNQAAEQTQAPKKIGWYKVNEKQAFRSLLIVFFLSYVIKESINILSNMCIDRKYKRKF